MTRAETDLPYRWCLSNLWLISVIESVVGGGGEASFEGDLEGVQGCLPAHRIVQQRLPLPVGSSDSLPRPRRRLLHATRPRTRLRRITRQANALGLTVRFEPVGPEDAALGTVFEGVGSKEGETRG